MTTSSSKEALLRSLESQSESFPHDLQEIAEAVAHEQYRKAFQLIINLKDQGRWHPTAEDEKNLEKFWWEYAN